MQMKHCNIGMIGVSVMGANLARNLRDHGYRVAVYDRDAHFVTALMQDDAQAITPCSTLSQLVTALEKPRIVWMMIRAGKPVDDVLANLLPLLDAGDVVIDGGNSYFEDTARRCALTAQHGVHFLGVGVSGGASGARTGPSLMPGGSQEGWRIAAPYLSLIAARAADGTPCCAYFGPDGAGHFVKTVHNGIEYADMQLIAESYLLLRELGGLSASQIADVFLRWNDGVLNSYLIEITARILKKRDEKTGGALVDAVRDAAAQKGTGMWTAQAALDLGIAAPTLAQAVFARLQSSDITGRSAAGAVFKNDTPAFDGDVHALIEDVHQALYASKICAYAQGFALLSSAAQTYGWPRELWRMALVWRGGCIIRAAFLEKIAQAWQRNPMLENLMFDPYFAAQMQLCRTAHARVCAQAAKFGVPAACLSSALSYADGYRHAHLGANLIQAQRDCFGAHTYERVDCDGIFHTQWLEDASC